MFTGVGGFELGIQRATKEIQDVGLIQQEDSGYKSLSNRTSSQHNKSDGTWQCIGFSETDKYASELLKQRFPDIKNYGDATKINPNELPDFDMLCGGFPCQAFSIAGKRKGFNETRGTLFFDICRIAKHKQPQYLFLENVKGLLSHDRGRTFAVILSSMDELGYDVEWQVCNSKFFGVPQNRERVFIIGHLRGKSRLKIFPIKRGFENIAEKSQKEHSESYSTLTATYYKGGKGMHINYAQKSEREYSRIYETDGIAPALHLKTGGWQEPKITTHSPRSGNPKEGGTGILESSEHCFTLDSTPHIVDRVRRLTPTECERLQSFPDGWTEEGKVFKGVKLFGNIWKDVQFKNVKEKSAIENQNSALNIIRGGENGEILTLSIPSEEKISENVELKGVIEKHIVEGGVCDTINLGKDMVMLSKAKETLNYEEIRNPNLMKERMEKQSTYPLWKITLEENSKKEKLSTILTLIKKTILSQTFICVKTEKPIIDVIITWSELEQNSLKKESLNLEMEYIRLMSDTQRYKMMGNAVTINIVEAIVRRFMR